MLVIELVNTITIISTALFAFLANKDGRIKKSTCCGSSIDYVDEPPAKTQQQPQEQEPAILTHKKRYSRNLDGLNIEEQRV